jgi:hypothetical protein
LREKAARRGAHRKGEDNGDARTEFGTEEGLQWWKTRRGGRLGGGEACAALGRGRARQTACGEKNSAGGRWLGLRVAWDNGERGSGSGDVTRRRARGAWLRPVGGVPNASRPRRARAARLCFGSDAPMRLTRGPQLSAGDGVRRERRGCAWAGPEKRGVGRARRNSNV